MQDNQNRLLSLLPPMHTGYGAPKHYAHLAELPDEICLVLIPLAEALTSGDCIGRIQASIKLQKLASMSQEDVVRAFDSEHSGASSEH